jgi:PAS domain S-box-containing protein
MGSVTKQAFGALLTNGSLLLAFAYVFHLYSHHAKWAERRRGKLAAGLAAGVLCIALMWTPYQLEPGVQFDTRSVVLSLTGLFFGPLATVAAVVLAAAFRLWLGGVAAWTGTSVIVSSATLGLLLRRLWRRDITELAWTQLLALGLAVHVVMLALMFTIPGGIGARVVEVIALPVLTIHPLATLVLGLTLVARLRGLTQERAFAEQEERLRLLAENTHDVVYRYELSPPRFSYISPSVTRLIGFTPEEHYADPALGRRLVVPEDLPRLESLLSSPGSGGGPIIVRWRHRDGRIVWTEQIIRVIRDPAGKPVALVGSARDVSAREEATARLREREEAYRRLFEAHPRPLWVSELETLRFLAVNDAAVDEYGYTREEFLTMTTADLLPREPPTRRPGRAARTCPPASTSTPACGATEPGRAACSTSSSPHTTSSSRAAVQSWCWPRTSAPGARRCSSASASSPPSSSSPTAGSSPTARATSSTSTRPSSAARGTRARRCWGATRASSSRASRPTTSTGTCGPR